MRTLGLLIIGVVSASAQTPLQKEVREDFVKFQSVDPMQRAAAFYDLSASAVHAAKDLHFPGLTGSRMRFILGLWKRICWRRV